MMEQQPPDSVLILSDELIPNEDSAGHDAIAKDPAVLLLDVELSPEPVIKKIEVGPRVSVAGAVEDHNERAARSELSDAAHAAKPPGRRGKAIWQGGLPVQSATTFIRRGGQGSAQPESSGKGSSQLASSLAEARAFAAQYGAMQARTRMALYDALGRTYDCTIRADEQPAQFAQMIESAGLTVMDRAPHTPIVKLVFGADYDKTRIAEFAAAITYGRRKNLPIGGFTAFLEQVEGGLKAVVGLERLFRKGEPDPSEAALHTAARPAIARRLREIEPTAWVDLPAQGDEFALLVARRLPDGSIVMVGEVPRDIGLLEKAARKLLAERVRADPERPGPAQRIAGAA